jgi:hypothetical protein
MVHYRVELLIQSGFYDGLSGVLRGELKPMARSDETWVEGISPTEGMEEALKYMGQWAKSFPDPVTGKVTVTLCALISGGQSLNQEELVRGRDIPLVDGRVVIQYPATKTETQ